jgi:DNA-binding Lrp family transcriptional regulator
LINRSRYGYDYYRIYLKFDQFTPSLRKSVTTYLKKRKGTFNLRVTEGNFDLNFSLTTKSLDDVNLFMDSFGKEFGESIIDKNIHNLTNTYRFNSKIFFDDGQTQKIVMHHAMKKKDELDKLDLAILSNLSNKARIKLIELANVLGEKPQSIQYRLKNLEKKGVIAGYCTTINLERINHQMMQIDISVKEHEIIKSILEFFDVSKKMNYAYEMAGKYDLSVEIFALHDEFRGLIEKFTEKFNDDLIDYDSSTVFYDFPLSLEDPLIDRQSTC